MNRRLTAAEIALWQQVAATVKAFKPLPEIPDTPEARPPALDPRPDRTGVGARKARLPPRAPVHASASPRETLDSTWDKRLASGKARPDRVIDLHGFAREAARHYLERSILAAADRGERLLLVITGKGNMPGPAPADLMGERPGRGAIRAELPRWLALPSLSSRIAAVRRAHPRHGGAGAVYLVLKRSRTNSS
ncbi:Smr/MutS family protein [Thermaurantiacus sp.]